jgi:hypothetical protein
MILDNPPNQIAGRGALSSGKYLELLEDHLRKFHCSLHDNHCPMSGSLVELLTNDRISLLLLVALLIMLMDAFWFHPRAVRAQRTLKVYVQQVTDKRWTDIKGTEIVGFASGPFGGAANSTMMSACFVASR